MNRKVQSWNKPGDPAEAAEQFELGCRYYDGEGVKQDYQKAIDWYRKAADQGDADAQNRLGYMCLKAQGLEQNKREAFEWFQKAAHQGLARAQYNLGYMRRKGLGVEQDDCEAVEWYRKAAEQGLADAQKTLAYMYWKGQGVEQDDKKAIDWYRKAAEQGDPLTLLLLARRYRSGEGVKQDYREAIKWYRKAAEQGNAGAQYNLGDMYDKGEGVKQNHRKAAKWYRKAAEQGHSDAQAKLGYMYMYQNGLGEEQNDLKAIKWYYRKEAEQGDADAQFKLGIMYDKGRGGKQDYRKATKWYRKSAEQGHADAQANLGYMYKFGEGVKQDYRKAAKWYRKAAEQGHADAQANLGYMYQNGWGVKQDDHKAAAWYHKAAKQGNDYAQTNLGWMYQNGRGVAQDNLESVDWYRKAAEQGNSYAQNNLGIMYQSGLGLDQDGRKAVEWYHKAAKQGHADAQANLGYMYQNGQGVEQDNCEAVDWYRRATEQGNAYAQYNLGVMYQNGLGVDQDDREAIKWYRKAADQEYPFAQAKLGYMNDKGYGVKQNSSKAAEWYRKAARLEDVMAQPNLEIIRRSRVEMVPETIFAVPAHNTRGHFKSGWEIHEWECSLDQVAQEFEIAGWNFEDVRVLCEHQVRKELVGYQTNNIAIRNRWLADSEHVWHPMEETTPAHESAQENASIELSLLSVDENWINLEFNSNGTSIPLTLDIHSKRTQRDLDRIANLILEGNFPHLAFVDSNHVLVSLYHHTSPNFVRLRVRSTNSEGDSILMDAAITPKSLVNELRNTLLELSHHPSFESRGLCFDKLLDQVTESLEMQAEKYCEHKRDVILDDWLQQRVFVGCYSEDEYRNETIPCRDEQGIFYDIYYRVEGRGGWNKVQAKDIYHFISTTADERREIVESRVVAESIYRLYGSYIFLVRSKIFKEGRWKYDRYYQCWRAPGEKVQKPDWSIPIEVLKKREEKLCVMKPTAAVLRLEIVSNVNKACIHREVCRFDDGRIHPPKIFFNFTQDVADYLVDKGVVTGCIGALRAVCTEVYEFGHHHIEFGQYCHELVGGGKEWTQHVEPKNHFRPFTHIFPDYFGAYAWGTGLEYYFPEFPDVAIIDSELENEWQPKFEGAQQNIETGELELDWDSFHQHGMALAVRLKAIVGKHGDVVYLKPFEDPTHKWREYFFVVPKDWSEESGQK
ncbi:SEL1-like repeat protein [Pseudomonadota bacterium]